LVGGASIAYHLFESRLRNGGQENDFSRWLEAELVERELAGAVRGLDPYSYTADGLRHRLVGMITQRQRSRLEPRRPPSTRTPPSWAPPTSTSRASPAA